VGKVILKELILKDSFVIEPEPFKDNRGEFSRIFCKDELKDIFDGEISQINHSITFKKGTFRGFHYQQPPYGEIKIVKAIKGSIIDIIIDLRKSSPTFLKSHSEILSSENKKMIFIPKGFAHGFQTLEDKTELIYFHSEFFNKSADRGLNYLDKKLNIKLPLEVSEISDKDKNQTFLTKEFKGI
jgi:dTDP-4-dehydrorhamnose 3,5-epimerase